MVNLIIVFIISLFAFSGCSTNNIDSVSKHLSTYNMEIEYVDELKKLNVEGDIEYINNTNTILNNLCFHLYPKSFKLDAENKPVSTLNYNKAYYNGASNGDILISKVMIKDTLVNPEYLNNDKDILKVNLLENLHPNQRVKIDIDYEVIIPNVSHRFGFGRNTINIANFYPVACIYEGGKFVIDSYHYNGDPFYTDMANYNITLKADNNFIIASTGNVTLKSKDETKSIYSINANCVRDYAFVMSKNFEVISQKLNNIEINYFYYKFNNPNKALQTAVDSMKYYIDTFGQYPYKVLNVVETNFVHGGMEYPNLVYISDDVDKVEDYLNVIAHEIAHQWWYQIVGSNAYKYPWLDEGLTEYSTLLFYENNPSYGVDVKELITNTTSSYANFVSVYNKVFGTVDTSMNRSLNEYNSETEHVYISYVKGMLFYNSLREIVGDKNFFKALKKYVSVYRFQNVTPEHLRSTVEEVTKMDLKGFFDSWILGKVKIMTQT